VEADAQLLEFKCVPFAEEVMYGHLRKRSGAGEAAQAEQAQEAEEAQAQESTR
jgi:hypothetical protein